MTAPRKHNRTAQKPILTHELYPELQRLERDGLSLAEIAEHLLAAHGVTVSLSTISRALATIREEAPLEPPPDPKVEAATEQDDIKIVRRFARQEMSQGEDWRQRHSGAALLMQTIKLGNQMRQQARDDAASASASASQTASMSATPTPQLAPEMTPEQEAAAVRAQLGKCN